MSSETNCNHIPREQTTFYTEVEEISPNYSHRNTEETEISEKHRETGISPSEITKGTSKNMPIDLQHDSGRLFSKVKHELVIEQESSFRPRCSTESQVSLMKKRFKCRKNVTSNGKKVNKTTKTIGTLIGKSSVSLSDSDSNGFSLSPDSKLRRVEETSHISVNDSCSKNLSRCQGEQSPENETGFRPRLYSDSRALLMKKRQNLIKKGVFKKEKENGYSYTIVQGAMKKAHALLVSNSKPRQEMQSNVKILINMDKALPRAESDGNITMRSKHNLSEFSSSPEFGISNMTFRKRHDSESKYSKLKEEKDKGKGCLFKEMQFLELPRCKNSLQVAFDEGGRRSSSPVLPPINSSHCASDGQLRKISLDSQTNRSPAYLSESLTESRVRPSVYSDGNDRKTNRSSDLSPISSDSKGPCKNRLDTDEILSESRNHLHLTESPFRPRLHSEGNDTRTKRSLGFSPILLDSKESFRPRRNTDDILSARRRNKNKENKSKDDSFCRSGRIGFRKTEMIDGITKFDKIKSSDKKCSDGNKLRQPKTDSEKSKTKKSKKPSNSKNGRNGRNRKSCMLYDRHPFDEISIGSAGEPSDLSSTPTEIPTRTPEPDLFKEFSEFDDGFATPSLPPLNNPLYRPRYCWCTRCQIMYNLYKEDDERLEVWGNYPCFKF